MNTILNIRDLQTHFFTERGLVKAVDKISLDIEAGTTFGLVGESGCGKSVTALSIIRLVPNPPGKIVGGEILFKGRELLHLTEKEMCAIRGKEISMVFQEPMTSLNPVFTIGNQLAEGLRLHRKMSKSEAKEKSLELMKMVGIPSPEKRIREYPHQMSGGMRQRVMIAMAISCNPSLLIADEPTTALDVTIQAQILELIKGLMDTLGMTMILISHDLGIIARIAKSAAIMYAGKIVEKASVETLFHNPRHPYTVGLLRSAPRPDREGKRRLDTIAGSVPNLLDLPPGCAFHPRCSYARDICKSEAPPLRFVGENGHLSACFFAEKVKMEN
jgi:oligopeptide/dipeptide ABC transporter ATP-binding protein